MMSPNPVVGPVTPAFMRGVIYYALAALITMATLIAILVVVSAWKLGKDAERPISQLILTIQGDGLRMLTVVFLVTATTGLVMLGPIDGGHAATIFSGIAGYILGSSNRAPKPSGGASEPKTPLGSAREPTT